MEKYKKMRLEDSKKLTKAVILWREVKPWRRDQHGGEFPIFVPCAALCLEWVPVTQWCGDVGG